MATREILQRPLDAAANQVTGLPTSVAASDAVRRDEMLAGDAAVSAAIPALSSATPAAADAAAGNAGVAATAARGDHKHAVTVGTPVPTGTVNADGAATSLARSDHVHQTSFAGVAAALAAATADVSLNAHKLTGIADGTAAQDAVAFHQITRAPAAGEFWVYTVDYDGAGNDSTGAAGIATTMATALAAATPLKTLERAGQIIPRDGNSATLVVLVKPRASAAAYRNIANSADQDGSWLNALTNWHFLARGSLDFTNNTNDKIGAGFLTASGTNAPGYAMVATVRTITVTGADHVTSVPDPKGFPAVPTWVFANGAFTSDDVDRDFTTAGITNAGTRRILQVVNATTIITDGTVTNETFNTGSPTAAVKSSIRNFTCQLSGGGAPSFPAESGGFSAITGLRIRFKSTSTTTALQNLAVGVLKNTTTSIKPMVALPALPVAGDEFVIETPGVTVANLTHVAGVNRTFCLVGFNATGTTTMTHRTGVSRVAGCNFTSIAQTFGEQYVVGQTYTDEADAAINVGYGYRATGTPSVSSCLAVTVSASSWLGSTQFSVGNNVLSSFVGSGCVSVQGYRNNTTAGPGVTSVGGFGNATFQRFRVTGANIGGTAGIHCGGLGARIFGAEFANCTTAQIAVDSPNTASGEFYIDDIVSPDGGNVGGASPNESCVLRVTGTKSRDGLVVICGSTAGVAITSTADRDISGDGGLRGRFKDLQRQPLVFGGVHIYGGILYLAEWLNDAFAGPASTMETSNTGFFGSGPFPPFRVWHSRGNILNAPTSPSVAEPAVADTEANCAQVMGVNLNYVWASGDAVALARAGTVKIEFVLGQLSTFFVGQYAYLSEAGGADSGKARVGPPPTGVVVPLGPIQAVDCDTVDSATPIYGMVNLFSGGRIFVPEEGHAAESVIANPTGAQGSAVDVALGTDQILGRLGSAHVAGIPISTIAGIPVGGHTGFSVLGKATTGTGDDADIPVGTSAVVGRSGSGDVVSIGVGGGVEFSGAAIQRSALTGDATAPAGSGVVTIAAGAVTNAKRANMAANTLSGNNTGSPAAPADLTAAAVKLMLAISFADVGGTLPAGAFPALTGDVTTPGGSLATTLANLPQSVLLTRTGALTAAMPMNAQKITGMADPTSAQDAATKHYVDASFTGGVPLVDGNKGDITVSSSGADWEINARAITFAELRTITTDTLIGRDTAGTGDAELITVGGGIEFTGSGGIQRSALTGDVSASAGSAGTVINPGVVTNAQLATVPTGTLKGRTAAGTGAPSDLTLAVVKAALAISFSDISGTLLAAQFPALTGDVTTPGGSLATTLASTGVTAATYGDGSHVAQVTVDAKGRVTAASSPSISISAGAVSGLAAIATTGAGGDLTANSVTDAKLRQGAATSVIGRAANSTGNVADIAATVDDRVLGRRAGALGYFQINNPMLGNGAVALNKFQDFPPFTMLGNDVNATTIPNCMTVAAVRTFLGLDAPQSFEFEVSFGIGDASTADSVPPRGVVGNFAFWLMPVTRNSDINVLGYIGAAVDANLNQPEVAWELVVDSTYGHCDLLYSVTKWDPQSSGGASVAVVVSKNTLVDSSPAALTITGAGKSATNPVSYSFVRGDTVGVRILPNGSWGDSGTPHLKITCKVRLTP